MSDVQTLVEKVSKFQKLQFFQLWVKKYEAWVQTPAQVYPVGKTGKKFDMF